MGDEDLKGKKDPNLFPLLLIYIMLGFLIDKFLFGG